MKKIGIVSLGCAKNLVDSEMILAMFDPLSYSITSSPKDADIIIINTCGFIEAAKKESIETILEMRSYRGAKLVVVGCFVERYLQQLKEEMPDVDLFIPLKDYPHLGELIGGLFPDETPLKALDPLKRVLSTPDYCAYLRISEGCDNFCAFCAIPFIRGRFISRPFDEIIKEAEDLKSKGIKEISIVSQDTANYGKDFPKGGPRFLDLLKTLDAMGFYSIRLLYLYPEEISLEMLEFIKDSHSVAHYFDVPIQCASDHLLKLMRRHGTTEDTRLLFHKIREMMPEAILRTTLIAGFPGENEEDRDQTLNFLEEIKFDHLGVFAYSQEEGTLAASYKDQLSLEEKEAGRDAIMRLQKNISYERNKLQVGKEMEGIVTGFNPKSGLYTLRSYWNAPDDIDGRIDFSSKNPLKVGDIVKVKVTNAFVYDLMGEAI